MSAVAIPDAGRSNIVTNTLTIARRNLLHIKATPEQLVEMSIQPLMFLVLFVYVFGGAIATSSKQYLQFALPGILVQTVAFLPFTTAIAINVDFQRGVIDGFRVTWSVLLITGLGVVLGFRFGGTPVEGVAAMALVIAFGLVMCWPMALIGITARTTESVNTWGFLIILPLTFISSAFVPPETMPGWLQAFAEWNPVTAVIDAARRLMLGLPVGDALARSIAWMIAIVAVFAPLAIARYRRRV
jgi:hypothetical protein